MANTPDNSVIVILRRRVSINAHALARLHELLADILRLQERPLIQEMLPAPLAPGMLALGRGDLSVRAQGVEDGEVIPTWVAELAPSLADGLALLADVEEDLGGGGEDGHDVEHFVRAPVRG